MASLRNIWLESPLLRRCYAPVEYCFATLRRQSRESNPFLTAKKVKIQSTDKHLRKISKVSPFHIIPQSPVCNSFYWRNTQSEFFLAAPAGLPIGTRTNWYSHQQMTSNQQHYLPLVLNKRQYVITSRLDWSGLQIPCALLKTRRMLKLSNSETPVDISGLSFELLPDTFYFELSSLSEKHPAWVSCQNHEPEKKSRSIFWFLSHLL